MMTVTREESPEYRARQELYAYLYDHPLFLQLRNGYNRTKQSSSLARVALQGVEDRFTDATNRAMPAYEYYLQPRVDTLHCTVNKGFENTKRVLGAAKSTTVTATTIGIGAGVVVVQLVLSLIIAGMSRILDGVTSVMQTGGNAVGRLKETEKSLEGRFRSYVEHALNTAWDSFCLAPLAKLADLINTVLDIANKFVDRLLGVNGEADPVDCTIGDRIVRIVRRSSQVLRARAQDNVIEPLTNQMRSAMEQLNSYMKLVDYVHERRKWVAEKVEGMHASVSSVKANVERQANEVMSRPEVVLMESVRTTSQQIIDNANKLKEKGAQLLGTSAAARLDGVVAYLSELERNFAEANDLYELRDEVLSEARAKLTDFLNWTSSLLTHKLSSDPSDGGLANGVDSNASSAVGLEEHNVST